MRYGTLPVTSSKKSSARKPGARRKTQRRSIQRKPRKKTRKSTLNLKKGVRRAVYDFYLISVIFLILLTLSSAFLLYQWKNYQIVEFGKEIQQLQVDVLKLQSSTNRNQARINTELVNYHRIAQLVDKKLGLKPSVEEPVVLPVDQKELEYYVQKDKESNEKE